MFRATPSDPRPRFLDGFVAGPAPALATVPQPHTAHVVSRPVLCPHRSPVRVIGTTPTRPTWAARLLSTPDTLRLEAVGTARRPRAIGFSRRRAAARDTAAFPPSSWPAIQIVGSSMHLRNHAGQDGIAASSDVSSDDKRASNGGQATEPGVSSSSSGANVPFWSQGPTPTYPPPVWFVGHYFPLCKRLQ